MNGVKLVDAIERSIQNPETFKVPSHEELNAVTLGDYVKVILVPDDGRAERVWLQVTAVGITTFEGVLDSIPLQSELLPPRGSVLVFQKNNVIDIEKL